MDDLKNYMYDFFLQVNLACVNFSSVDEDLHHID